MAHISFIVQGLSKRHIDMMLASSGMPKSSYQSTKLSAFRAIWRIGTLQTERLEKAESPSRPASGENGNDKESEGKITSYPDPGFLELPVRALEPASSAGEAGGIIVLILIAALLLTGSLFVWIFLSIPFLLLILSAVTFAPVWKMLRIYQVDLRDPTYEEIQGILNYVVRKGALHSRNVLHHFPDRGLYDRMTRLINNQKSIIRWLAITSYSVFFLGVIFSVDALFIEISDGILLSFTFVLGIPAVLAFFLSTYYLNQRMNLVHEYASAG
jgi:hypothetical protein